MLEQANTATSVSERLLRANGVSARFERIDVTLNAICDSLGKTSRSFSEYHDDCRESDDAIG